MMSCGNNDMGWLLSEHRRRKRCGGGVVFNVVRMASASGDIHVAWHAAADGGEQMSTRLKHTMTYRYNIAQHGGEAKAARRLALRRSRRK